MQTDRQTGSAGSSHAQTAIGATLASTADQLRQAAPEARLEALERLWGLWERSAERPLQALVVLAVGDEHEGVSTYALKMLGFFAPDLVRDWGDDVMDRLGTDRQLRLQVVEKLLTIARASDVHGTTSAHSATEGAMTRADVAGPDSVTRRDTPNGSLYLSLTFLTLSLGCLGLRFASGNTALVWSGVSFFGIASFAFFTRWLQRVDRSDSRMLQFLETVRCYIAHEEPTPRSKQL